MREHAKAWHRSSPVVGACVAALSVAAALAISACSTPREGEHDEAGGRTDAASEAPGSGGSSPDAGNVGATRDAGGNSASVVPQILAAGLHHTCAVLAGAMRCWGDDYFGQVAGSTSLSHGVSSVAAGDNHSCALVMGGVQCWGGGLNKSTPTTSSPFQVPGLTLGVTALASSGWNCAVQQGGAQCWGEGSCNVPDAGVHVGGAPGAPTPAPQPCDGPPVSMSAPVRALTSGVTAIAVGSSGHTCAVYDGGVRCWGTNGNGQLGNDSTYDSFDAPGVKVVGLSNVTAIAAGASFSCAIANGSLQCWGLNSVGELGNDSTEDSHVPVQVMGLTSGVTAVTAGRDHACALVDSGVRCWGSNAHGQLGDGSSNDAHVPVAVVGLMHGVQAIAAGDAHTCAILDDGVQCWGDGAFGQLGGPPGSVGSTVPVAVPLVP